MSGTKKNKCKAHIKKILEDLGLYYEEVDGCRIYFEYGPEYEDCQWVLLFDDENPEVFTIAEYILYKDHDGKDNVETALEILEAQRICFDTWWMEEHVLIERSFPWASLSKERFKDLAGSFIHDYFYLTGHILPSMKEEMQRH